MEAWKLEDRCCRLISMIVPSLGWDVKDKEHGKFSRIEIFERIQLSAIPISGASHSNLP